MPQSQDLRLVYLNSGKRVKSTLIGLITQKNIRALYDNQLTVSDRLGLKNRPGASEASSGLAANGSSVTIIWRLLAPI